MVLTASKKTGHILFLNTSARSIREKSFRIPKLTLLYFATENVTSPNILSKIVKGMKKKIQKKKKKR